MDQPRLSTINVRMPYSTPITEGSFEINAMCDPSLSREISVIGSVHIFESRNGQSRELECVFKHLI